MAAQTGAPGHTRRLEYILVPRRPGTEDEEVMVERPDKRREVRDGAALSLM